jgi:hypothetical protein
LHQMMLTLLCLNLSSYFPSITTATFYKSIALSVFISLLVTLLISSVDVHA